MQDKLEQIFPAKIPNLGMKHREIDRNLWTNDYLINVKNSLKYQDIDFDVDFDQYQPTLQDVNSLFID